MDLKPYVMRRDIVLWKVTVLLIAAAVASCNKKEPESIPVITITSPAANQIFNVYDTIFIEADIMDVNTIVSVMAGLTDKSLVSVQAPVFFYPQSTSTYHLSTAYPISNKDLETGDYYLQIRANNPSNYRNNYQKIFINEIPLEFEKIVVLTHKSANLIGVSSVSENGTPLPLFTIDGDYASSEPDSKNRQLYVAGISFFNLAAYNFETSAMVWIRNVEPPLPVHARNCLHFNEDLFSSYASYKIEGYRHNGSILFTAAVEDGLMPSRVFKNGEFLLADLQSKSQDDNYLAAYYLVTGSEKQRLANDFKVVDFFSLSDEQALIAANGINGGFLKEYDILNNILTEIVDVPGTIICTERVSDSGFLIGSENGNYLFVGGQSELVTVLPGMSPKRFRFDPVNQLLYSAEANLIHVISYPDLTVQNTFTLTDSILNFHLTYNK